MKLTDLLSTALLVSVSSARAVLTPRDVIADSPLLSLHKNLVDISSLSGYEREVSDYLKEYLESKSFTVETQDVPGFGGDRQNIYAYLGDSKEARTMVTSHLDTVPPFIPYKYENGTIWGRGSNDAKGSVAAQIIAVEQLIEEGSVSAGDIALLYVVGEEITGDGMEAVNELGLSWETVIFGEPTENKLAVGHKGILEFNVTAHGKAAHSGYPWLGVSANSALIKALDILDNLELPKSETLGNSTLNIGMFQGGVAVNVVSPEAHARCMVRLAGDYDETLQVIKDSLKELDVEISVKGGGYGPIDLDHEVPGFETAIMNYGTDVPHLDTEAKAYLYGPGS